MMGFCAIKAIRDDLLICGLFIQGALLIWGQFSVDLGSFWPETTRDAVLLSEKSVVLT